MKKHLLIIALLHCFAGAISQTATGDLDINNVKARINPAGDLFWDFTNPKFEVPKGRNRHTIFTANLWIGGLDAGGQLHMAAQTYRQTGTDFFQGPVMNQSAYSASTDAFWNKIWKVNRTTVDSLRNGLLTTIPSSRLSHLDTLRYFKQF